MAPEARPFSPCPCFPTNWVPAGSSPPNWDCLEPALGIMSPRSKVPLANEELSGFREGCRAGPVRDGGAEATLGPPFVSRLGPPGDVSLDTEGMVFLLRTGDPSGSECPGPIWKESTVGTGGRVCGGHGPCNGFRVDCLLSGPGLWAEAVATWVWEKIRWDLAIIWSTCICSWLTRDSCDFMNSCRKRGVASEGSPPGFCASWSPSSVGLCHGNDSQSGLHFLGAQVSSSPAACRTSLEASPGAFRSAGGNGSRSSWLVPRLGEGSTEVGVLLGPEPPSELSRDATAGGLWTINTLLPLFLGQPGRFRSHWKLWLEGWDPEGTEWPLKRGRQAGKELPSGQPSREDGR